MAKFIEFHKNMWKKGLWGKVLVALMWFLIFGFINTAITSYDRYQLEAKKSHPSSVQESSSKYVQAPSKKSIEWFILHKQQTGNGLEYKCTIYPEGLNIEEIRNSGVNVKEIYPNSGVYALGPFARGALKGKTIMVANSVAGCTLLAKSANKRIK